MKGFGTNEKELIRVLSKPDPAKMNSIRMGYSAKYKKDLVVQIKSETGGYLEQGLVALASGPLAHDADILRRAMKGKRAPQNDENVGGTANYIRRVGNQRNCN